MAHIVLAISLVCCHACYAALMATRKQTSDILPVHGMQSIFLTTVFVSLISKFQHQNLPGYSS